MKTDKQLKEERAGLVHQMTDLNKRADGRQLNDDETAQWEKIEADISSIEAQITRNATLKKQMASIADESMERSTGGEATPEQTKGDVEKRKEDAFRKLLRSGRNSLTSAESGYLQRGTDPQATTTGGLGGFTVPESFGDELIKLMAFYGGMLEVSNVMTTQTGASIPYPVTDQTTAKGRLIAENAAAVVKDIAFTQKTLGAYTYTSDIIKLSLQLIQDNGVDLVSEINPMLAERLGRIQNEHLTTGTGSGQPEGVVTAAAAGVTSAAVAGITRAEIINLIHSVDRAYRGQGRFMMHDSSMAAIRKLSIGSSDDRPLWVPSMREGEPDRLEGFAYTINNDMDELGAGNVPLLFGDFSKYRTRIVRDITFFEFGEKYMENLQRGYMAYMRMDGKLLDTSAIKKLTNAAS